MSGLVGQIGARTGVVGFHNPRSHLYTSLSNGWNISNIHTGTSHEAGIRVQNMGRLWIVNMMIEKNSNVGTETSEIVVNISNEFTMPSGLLFLGSQHFGKASENDYSALVELHASGNMYLYYDNMDGNYIQVVGNFIGLDIS